MGIGSRMEGLSEPGIRLKHELEVAADGIPVRC